MFFADKQAKSLQIAAIYHCNTARFGPATSTLERHWSTDQDDNGAIGSSCFC
jgi:hypothetical protein